MTKNLGNWLRRLSGVFIIVIKLALVFLFYFLKYIPEQQSTFHRNAFLELSQLQNAIKERDKAFRDAINNFLTGRNYDTTGAIQAISRQYDSFDLYIGVGCGSLNSAVLAQYFPNRLSNTRIVMSANGKKIKTD